jgi:DNA polymerase-3 subunit epsilon
MSAPCPTVRRVIASDPRAIASDPRARHPAQIQVPDGCLRAVDFVVTDVETTGWDPAQAAITEIAAVRFRDGRVCGQFASLVNPGTAIPPQITELTGITDITVAGAPALPAALADFLDFARGGVFTAHNAPFDEAFLIAACRACHLPWPGFDVLDTADLARRLLSVEEVPDCKLSTLSAHFGTATRPCHRALPDALATAEVLGRLLSRLESAGIPTLAAIASLPTVRGDHSHSEAV